MEKLETKEGKRIRITTKIHNNFSPLVNMFAGFITGYFASRYSLLILILALPYLFQMLCAIIFKNKI